MNFDVKSVFSVIFLFIRSSAANQINQSAITTVFLFKPESVKVDMII